MNPEGCSGRTEKSAHIELPVNVSGQIGCDDNPRAIIKGLPSGLDAGLEIVVTGDAHLLSMGDLSGIRIQMVAEFLV